MVPAVCMSIYHLTPPAGSCVVYAHVVGVLLRDTASAPSVAIAHLPAH